MSLKKNTLATGLALRADFPCRTALNRRRMAVPSVFIAKAKEAKTPKMTFKATSAEPKVLQQPLAGLKPSNAQWFVSVSNAPRSSFLQIVN